MDDGSCANMAAVGRGPWAVGRGRELAELLCLLANAIIEEEVIELLETLNVI